MRKKVTSLVLVLSMLTLAVGCGGSTGDELQDQINKMSKDQLRKEYRELYERHEQVCTDYDNLATVLKGIQEEENPSPAIGITGDGTGRFTFLSTDSKIIFPAAFQYPNAEQIAPNGSISIVDNVSVGVNSTWIYRLTGSALELEHSSGISGTIKVSKISTSYNTDVIQNDAMAPWFEQLPPSNVNYTRIFVNNQDVGIQARANTLIDQEDAFITCGMLGFGTYAITYIFVYRGVQDASKDESITNVVNSISLHGNKLLVGDN